MTVSPAAEPKPSLKYRFLVPAADQIRGNAATYVYKSMIFESPDYINEMNQLNRDDTIEKWLDTPLDQMPRDEILQKVRWLSEKSQWQSLCEAARCDQCQWGDLLREEGAFVQLPQAQKMRTMAHGINLRARLEIAQGQYSDAIETLRVGYALTRSLGRGPTLVHCLIGMAIQNLINEQTRTLMAAENSPNLYWALTDLSAQPMTVRDAISFETHIWEYTVHGLTDLEKRPLGADEATDLAIKVWDASAPLGPKGGKPQKNTKSPEEIATWAKEQLPQAQAYLLEQGYASENLKAMAEPQVALIYRWKQYLQLRDDFFKWATLPEAEACTTLKDGQFNVEKKIKVGVGEPFSVAIPVIQPSMIADLRHQRHVNLLRAIEALRLHAAEHGGWPEKLADVTAVPVPRDAFNGQPFEYSVKNGVATIATSDDVAWTTKSRAGAIRYELELRQMVAKEDKYKK